MHGYAEDRAATLEEAFLTGRQAVAADDRDADAHFALGRILYLRRDLDASIAECEAAVSYNPSFPTRASAWLARCFTAGDGWRRLKVAIEPFG
jgi:hypothetical protein